MTTDRRRIECAIFPRLFAVWMASAIDSVGPQVDLTNDKATLARLRAAEMQALYDRVTADKAPALKRRLDRLQVELLTPYAAKDMIELFVVLAYTLRDVIADGHLTLVAGSDFDVAYEDIKNTLLQHEARVDDACERAQSEVSQLRKALAERRLFGDA